jgi:acyl dehydratase
MREPKYYWEDFKVGETLEFGNERVTRDEILEFAGEFDPQPFHLDEAAAKASILGGLCASGWHTSAIVMRMMCEGYLLDSAAMGSPGVEEARWSKPVYVDDVLTVRRTCLDRRVSASRPEMGLTHFRCETRNQHGDTVMTTTFWMMFRRRDVSAPVGEPG